jgi:hypothetical protein
MRCATRITTILAASLAAAAITAPTAEAKLDARTDLPNNTVITYYDWCQSSVITSLPAQEELVINPVSGVGCVAVRVHDGIYSLAGVAVAPGWWYVDRTGSDTQRVRVDLTNGFTTIGVLVEPGRTKIG